MKLSGDELLGKRKNKHGLLCGARGESWKEAAWVLPGIAWHESPGIISEGLERTCECQEQVLIKVISTMCLENHD